jgi:hypothetical protein
MHIAQLLELGQASADRIAAPRRSAIPLAAQLF